MILSPVIVTIKQIRYTRNAVRAVLDRLYSEAPSLRDGLEHVAGTLEMLAEETR